jgi:hypothetical protein
LDVGTICSMVLLLVQKMGTLLFYWWYLFFFTAGTIIPVVHHELNRSFWVVHDDNVTFIFKFCCKSV